MKLKREKAHHIANGQGGGRVGGGWCTIRGAELVRGLIERKTATKSGRQPLKTVPVKRKQILIILGLERDEPSLIMLAIVAASYLHTGTEKEEEETHSAFKH